MICDVIAGAWDRISKSLKMPIDGDDFSNYVITLCTCFSMFV